MAYVPSTTSGNVTVVDVVYCSLEARSDRRSMEASRIALFSVPSDDRYTRSSHGAFAKPGPVLLTVQLTLIAWSGWPSVGLVTFTTCRSGDGFSVMLIGVIERP